MAKEPTQEDLDLYNGVKDTFKKTAECSDLELAATIKVLGYTYPDAFDLLRFVDAYMELRKRKESRQ